MSAGTDRNVCIWDYTVGGQVHGDGYLLKVLNHHSDSPRCLAFSESYDSDVVHLYVGTGEGWVLDFWVKDDLLNMEREAGPIIDKKSNNIDADIEERELAKARAFSKNRKSSIQSMSHSEFSMDDEDLRMIINSKVEGMESVVRGGNERMRRETVSKAARRGSVELAGGGGDSGGDRK